MVGTITLGSICLDGETVLPGSVCVETPKITFGDTGPDHMSLKWLRDINGNFVTANCIVLNISWHDLDRQGYIFGRPVFIDGQGYLCRSLKVGTKAGDPNEWDQLVSEYPNASNRYLHWRDTYFWGQESGSSVIHRVVRGYIAARDYGYLPKDTCTRSTGFRPVLEELPPVPDDLSALLGKDVVIYGQETDVFGILKQVTDYDLLIVPSLARSMEASTIVTDSCKWATWDNGIIAVAKNAPIWIEESKF